MGVKVCPRCGKPYRTPGQCPRCEKARAERKARAAQAGQAAPSRSKRTKAQEGKRREKNPWRSHYQSAEYRRARQIALTRTNGCCAVSGVRIADVVGGKWVMRGNGGIHHVVPLSRGGTDSPDNLVPLETSVHNRIDAELRARMKRAGA